MKLPQLEHCQIAEASQAHILEPKNGEDGEAMSSTDGDFPKLELPSVMVVGFFSQLVWKTICRNTITRLQETVKKPLDATKLCQSFAATIIFLKKTLFSLR
jgi:hypothetical protein